MSIIEAHKQIVDRKNSEVVKADKAITNEIADELYKLLSSDKVSDRLAKEMQITPMVGNHITMMFTLSNSEFPARLLSNDSTELLSNDFTKMHELHSAGLLSGKNHGGIALALSKKYPKGISVRKLSQNKNGLNLQFVISADSI
jgi:hypothetical protein